VKSRDDKRQQRFTGQVKSVFKGLTFLGAAYPLNFSLYAFALVALR